MLNSFGTQVELATFAFRQLLVGFLRVCLNDYRPLNMFRADEGLLNLRRVFLDETAGDVDYLLGITVGLGDF